MDLRLLFICLFLFIEVKCDRKPICIVTAPRQAKPMSTYTVSASLYNTDKNMNIRVRLGRKNGENSDVNKDVYPGEPTEIKLQIGNWEGERNLHITANRDDIRISSIERLTISKRRSIFIQTDKAVYQQNQKVQFRAFAIDDELKPFPANITIYITDPQDNRIKQYVHATLEKGVFSGELQLSDKPLLGTWYIKATIEPISATKSFSVEEYVLPTYEVKLALPPFATYNDTATPIRVEAKYSFGKAVQGSVQLHIDGECSNRYIYCPSRSINATLGKGGQVVIPLDISRILHPKTSYTLESTISLLAVVTEELTGKTMNTSGSLTIYPQAEKLTLRPTRDKFRPGLPFTIIATLSDQDNKPLSKPDAPIQFDITYNGNFENDNKLEDNRWKNGINVPVNGIITLDLQPPRATRSINVDASYKNLINSSYLFGSISHTINNQYLLIKMNNYGIFNVGNIATFHIYTTFNVEQLSYQIVSGGDNVYSTTRTFPATMTHDIHVTLTHEMTPKSHFIVYAVTENGDIIADRIEFAVDGFFQTPVKVSANPNVTEPGELVQVEIDSNPSAMVYLLGIDQNVLLLKSGNDVSKQQVEEEFYKRVVSSTNTAKEWWYHKEEYKVKGLFNDAGLFLVTSEQSRHYVPWGWRLHSRRRNYDFGEVQFLFQNSENHPEPVFAKSSSISHSSHFPMPEAPILESIQPPFMPPYDEPKQELVKLRHNFPETWIWKSVYVRNDGKAMFNVTAPDTITSWIISAIAMDDNTGLGISETNAKVTVFKPFFVSLNLPFSVVRGETLKLQALVFNYFNYDLEANVTLYNDNDDFEFTNCPNSTASCTTNLTIAAGEAASAVFPIVFNTVGYAKIKVSAIAVSPIMAGDAIQKELIVKAEGTTKFFNQAFLVDLRHKRSWSSEVELSTPEDMVPDSEHVEISIIGDIMGFTINNIDNLIRVPYGCGEQNMINFVPNIVSANYLRNIGELNENWKAKAIHNIEAGYQRELNYKHKDGSYSAFGKSDARGSTWLTAYVMKSFAQAKAYIPVDDDVIDKGLQFLQSVQASNGTFIEYGKVSHKAMQGAVKSSGLSMTAYILIAFLQIENPKYNSTVWKAINALEERFPNATDPYEVAIISYALHLANSSMKDIAFDKLKELSTQEGNFLYWKKLSNRSTAHSQKSSTDAINSLNVEATAYSLLTYATRQSIKKAVPIVRWMIGQRNEFGGFASTQDTVIGLEALSTVAGHLAIDVNSEVMVDIQYGGKAKRFSVSKENSLLLQQETLPADTQLVEISATGKGSCMLQVTWSYNVFNPIPSGTFFITAEVDILDGDSYSLVACARYYDDDDESSNMAIMQLSSLSGYTFDKKNEPTGAKKVEYDLGDTRLNLYYDEIGRSDLCVTAVAIRNNEIEDLKNAEVLVYDYYQQDKRAVAYYNIVSGVIH